MGNPFFDDVMLEYYNSHRDLEWEPEEVVIPEVIAQPQTLEDYTALSALTVSAYEHAYCVGRWYEQRRANRPIESHDVSNMARHVYGLRLLSRRLNRANIRCDFGLFDGVSSLPVSIHSQMVEEIWKQSTSVSLLNYRIVLEDPEGFANLSPQRFTQLLEAQKAKYWYDQDRWDKYSLAKAEVSKLGVHFARTGSDTPKPKSDKLSHDTSEKIPLAIPENPDVIEMCRFLRKYVQDRSTAISCAQEWCGKNGVDPKKCKDLFRQCERFPWLWKHGWEFPNS